MYHYFYSKIKTNKKSLRELLIEDHVLQSKHSDECSVIQTKVYFHGMFLVCGNQNATLGHLLSKIYQTGSTSLQSQLVFRNAGITVLQCIVLSHTCIHHLRPVPCTIQPLAHFCIASLFGQFLGLLIDSAVTLYTSNPKLNKQFIFYTLLLTAITYLLCYMSVDYCQNGVVSYKTETNTNI